MKKLTLLAVILLTIGMSGIYAQIPRAYISLSAGLSMPHDDFAATDFDNPESGFANNGLNINLSYAHRLTYNIGVCGTLSINSNSLNTDALKEGIIGDTINIAPTIETKNWGAGGLLAGPFLYLPIGNFLSVDLRALIGFYTAYSPEIIIIGKQANGENFRLRLLKYNGVGFAYDLGSTLRFKFGRTSYLVLNADWLSSTSNFKDIPWLDTEGQIINTSFKQNFSMLNVTVGIGYAL